MVRAMITTKRTSAVTPRPIFTPGASVSELGGEAVELLVWLLEDVVLLVRNVESLAVGRRVGVGAPVVVLIVTE